MLRPFRFSVQAFEATSAKQWTELARQAEDLGYSTLFTTDHYFGPGEISATSGHRPVDVAPVSAMMSAAAVTERLRVGCRVSCVDYHNPVVLAKELATIDVLSEGRLEAGLGAGWVAAEYDGLGIPMDSAGVRIERLAEVVSLLQGALGRRRHQHRCGSTCTPTASPADQFPCRSHIHRSSSAVDRRGSSDWPVGSLTSSASTSTTRQDGSGRRALPVRHCRPPGRSSSGCAPAPVTASTTSNSKSQRISWPLRTIRPSAVQAMAARFGVTPEELTEHPHALLGSMDEVCDRLQQRREELGISYINVAQRSMTSFAPVVARLAGN